MNTLYLSVSEYFLIGKSLKSHGTGGELRLMIEDQFKNYISAGVFIFFDINGSKVPYRITGFEDANHFVVSLEDVINKSDSDVLSGVNIWIPIEIVKIRHQQSTKNIHGNWHEYSIIDEENQIKFEIIKVEEYPQQLMAIVQMDHKEILIPLAEHLISQVDKGKKIIYMRLPDGLMDL